MYTLIYCTKCETEKLEDDFYRSSRSASRGICIKCRKRRYEKKGRPPKESKFIKVPVREFQDEIEELDDTIRFCQKYIVSGKYR